jgi:hypothetical protein
MSTNELLAMQDRHTKITALLALIE